MNDRPAAPPKPISPGLRLAGVVLIVALQLLYIPLNHTLQGGVALHAPWDDLIPVWPIWTVPYLLSITWWLGFIIWAAWRMDSPLYLAFVVAGVAAISASYAIHWLLPTYVERPDLSGDSWPVDLLRLVYAQDSGYNAFPSGHTYNTVLIGLFWWRWQPRHRILNLGIAGVILLSTLFTGQHYLVDLLGGAAVAWTGYRFGLWWAAKRLTGGEDARP